MLNQNEIRAVTAHEIGHAARYDSWLNVFISVPKWIIILLVKPGLDLELILNRVSSPERTDSKVVGIKPEFEIDDYFPDPYLDDPFDADEITVETNGDGVD